MTIMLVVRALVALSRITLLIVMRKLGFDTIANLYDREIGCSLQNGAGDEVADTARELFVNRLTTSIANDGGNHALGVLGSDAAHVCRSDVALFELGILTGLFIGLAYWNELVHVDLARLAVDCDACIPFKVEDALVAVCK